MTIVTIADVAKKAGVSKTTVSHMLSGKRPVAPETQARIEQVIKELGFQPNALARSLRMQQTYMVALILPDITNAFYPTLARGLQDALVEHGYSVFICNTDSDIQREQTFIKDALQRQVDGLVLSSLHRNTKIVPDDRMAYVSIGQSITHPDIDRVSSDDHAGAKLGVRYLIERGHTRIAMIAGSRGLYPNDSRQAGYCEALEEGGYTVDPTLIAEGDFYRHGGARAMRQLMALPERPTAIFCANDLMAIGALDVVHEMNIAVPGDVAIVGYDDIEAASLITPALTTVVNPAYETGQRAGKLLLERMQGTYDGPARQIMVPYELIVRASA
ncbi:LacI family DNA-binding transcriptional regulator [Dictyobacter formicarum]|uniref:LacI family transcriptional regulator n=1 Tax=Dictyobacter formicarum TaxID=2778368 RepID=A0ABQ3VNS2_9CHLR|nr:LacI family DNA-binding transcriptional regulator [Dictyobacter formicarum]GHO87309.1 LacI family transcriptional regulator [Dictyobacter formicarum]